LVATRRNDRTWTSRTGETWTVTAVTDEGGLRVSRPAGEHILPAAYLATEVELACAITAHGAQGHTVDHAHLILDEHTTAAAAYVGLTRGRHSNTAHILTADETDAREQWSMVFARGRADLGPAVARDTAAREAARYAPTRPLDAVLPTCVKRGWPVRTRASGWPGCAPRWSTPRWLPPGSPGSKPQVARPILNWLRRSLCMTLRVCG
jgi:hypothetical protein